MLIVNILILLKHARKIIPIILINNYFKRRLGRIFM